MKNSGTDAGDVYARWLDSIGEQLVAQVEVEIGGQRMDQVAYQHRRLPTDTLIR